MAAKNRETSGVPLKQYSESLNKQELFSILKSEIFFTPRTKPTERIDTRDPVSVPKIITWKIMFNIFKVCYKKFSPIRVYRMFKNCQILTTALQLTHRAIQPLAHQ